VLSLFCWSLAWRDLNGLLTLYRILVACTEHSQSKEIDVLSWYLSCVDGTFPVHKDFSSLEKLYRYRPAHDIIVLPLEALT